MDRLERSQFPDWLSEHLRGAIPSAYTLELPLNVEHQTRSALALDLQERGLETLSVDPQSGSVTFVLPTSREYDVREEFSGAIFAACTATDERNYFWASPEDADEQHGTLEVRSRLFESDLPVLGPGGRVLLVASGERLIGDATIRRRIDEQPADSWRWPPEIEARLAGYDELALTIFAEIGYFELSQRESQHLLRPVVIVVVEHEPDPNRAFDVGWRRVLVEPITEHRGVAPDVGIGLWYDPEAGVRG